MVSFSCNLTWLFIKGKEKSASLSNGWLFVKGENSLIQFRFSDIACIQALVINDNGDMQMTEGQFFGNFRFTFDSNNSKKTIFELEVKNWPMVLLEIGDSSLGKLAIVNAAIANHKLDCVAEKVSATRLTPETPTDKSFHLICTTEFVYIGEIDENNNPTGEGYRFDFAGKSFTKSSQCPDSKIIKIEQISLDTIVPVWDRYFIMDSKPKERLYWESSAIPCFRVENDEKGNHLVTELFVGQNRIIAHEKQFIQALQKDKQPAKTELLIAGLRKVKPNLEALHKSTSSNKSFCLLQQVKNAMDPYLIK